MMMTLFLDKCQWTRNFNKKRKYWRQTFEACLKIDDGPRQHLHDLVNFIQHERVFSKLMLHLIIELLAICNWESGLILK